MLCYPNPHFSPFPHHNERILITRAVCEALNGLAWDICQG